MSQSLYRFCGCMAMAVAFSAAVFAQPVDPAAVQQISAVFDLKRSLTPAQQKLSFDLVVAETAARQALPASFPATNNSISAQGPVLVDLKVSSIEAVALQIGALGGQVVGSWPVDGAIRATVPLGALDSIAAMDAVNWIRSADQASFNGPRRKAAMRDIPQLTSWKKPGGMSFFIGAVTSQGYVSHQANTAVGQGYRGAGVKVGVISDSATAAGVSALIATGDLPADVVVVPGQASTGTNEGIAMMEIVHDLAPDAKLFFATANGGQAQFAANIRTLRNTYNCDLIVDDVTYFAEGAFQDGTVAKAVNDVTASGALYFSSAANSGNLTLGTSGTWEGDFVNGGAVGTPITGGGETGLVHSFGALTYDVLSSPSSVISLKWSDPLAGSTNDYDLFILNSTGTTVKGFSAARQTGTQDPLEIIGQGTGCGTATPSGYCPAAGDRLVIVLFAGVPRALRLDTHGGRLSAATAGSTFGHNGAPATMTTAATAWNSAHAGTRPFTGPANPIEPFSSDGPRKLFYNSDGTTITPGNVLFSTNGGTTFQKPDVTGADGTFAKTSGFLPFFGTSAAAPHAAAVAALVKSAKPSITTTQLRSVLTSTALDNMAAGVDRDGGYGIVMAIPAINAALLLP